MKIKREAKLAIAAIAAVCILIWGINFLKGTSLFDSKTTYYGIYDKVDGLKVSSGVMYRGYQVGQVSKIVFVGDRLEKVLVEFFLKEDLALPKDSKALIQSADLMGSKVINLLSGSSNEPLQDGDTLTAEVERGMMEAVGEQIVPFKRKAERLLVSLDSVLVIMQEVLDMEARENLKGSIRNLNQTLSNLEGASDNLNKMLDGETGQVGRVLAHVEGIAGNLERNNENVSNILGNVSALSDSLRQADLKGLVGQAEQVAAQMDSLLMKINKGEGTVGAFVKDSDLYYNLSEASENLNRFLVEFRHNPKKFIRLSLVDFSSNKSDVGEYAVVIRETTERLAANDSLYRKHSGLCEIRHRDKYLYVVDTYKKLKQAQKKLAEVADEYENAYIVRVDFY